MWLVWSYCNYFGIGFIIAIWKLPNTIEFCQSVPFFFLLELLKVVFKACKRQHWICWLDAVSPNGEEIQDLKPTPSYWILVKHWIKLLFLSSASYTEKKLTSPYINGFFENLWDHKSWNLILLKHIKVGFSVEVTVNFRCQCSDW